MIVNRFIIHVKPGKMDEALKMATEGSKSIWSVYPSKVYASMFGPMNTMIIDCEFKDVAEQQKLTAQVSATDEWASWLVKFNELITGQGTYELWALAE